MTDHPDIVERQYAERDHEAQGKFYLRHIDAMTGEGLHAKSAIAAELAHRDIEITRLRAEAEALRKALVLVMDYPDVRKYLGSQVANVADAAIAATKEQQA